MHYPLCYMEPALRVQASYLNYWGRDSRTRCRPDVEYYRSCTRILQRHLASDLTAGSFSEWILCESATVHLFHESLVHGTLVFDTFEFSVGSTPVSLCARMQRAAARSRSPHRLHHQGARTTKPSPIRPGEQPAPPHCSRLQLSHTAGRRRNSSRRRQCHVVRLLQRADRWPHLRRLPGGRCFE